MGQGLDSFWCDCSGINELVIFFLLSLLCVILIQITTLEVQDILKEVGNQDDSGQIWVLNLLHLI